MNENMSKKQAVVAELKEQLTSAKGVVLTGYKGLTVAQDTALRREFREAGVTYHVVKNTMLRLAAHNMDPCFLLLPESIFPVVKDAILFWFPFSKSKKSER